MSRYSLVNLIALIPAVGIGVYLRRRKELGRTLKISLVAPLLSFPWLYFGIRQKAWSHGDAGPRLMSVPLNEVALSFILTFLNTGLFIVNYRTIIDEARRSAESKNGSTQEKEDYPG